MSNEMDPQEKKFKVRKDIIKNVAIIFLAVMLVLTFFSNTIMNYSLPQVAVEYVQAGQITTKIRGTGTVESGDPYNVMVKQQRTVSSINKMLGDKVTKGDLLLTLAQEDSKELEDAKKVLETANKAYQSALLDTNLKASEIEEAKKGVNIDAYRNQITAAQNAVDAAKNDVEKYQKAYDDALNLSGLADKNTISAAERTECEKLKNDAEAKKAAYDSAFADYMAAHLGADKDAADNDPSVKPAKDASDAAQKAYNDKVASIQKREDEFTDFATSVSIQVANASANLKAVQGTYENKVEELSELKAKYDRIIALRDLLENIDDAQAEVTKLAGESAAFEVTAPINGTIIAINVQSGKDTDTQQPVVVLQPEGQGYFMSFTVENEQAKLISVGDSAEVANAWWYNDVTGKIKTIKPDTAAPQKNKLVTLELTGDLVDGQSLTMSISSRTTNYDMIVPNSALHEDNNGKFVLVVISKPSPLGNRYFAERRDVEVLASDDTKTAVNGIFDGYEYVITTSTKPINTGDQVRLSES